MIPRLRLICALAAMAVLMAAAQSPSDETRRLVSAFGPVQASRLSQGSVRFLDPEQESSLSAPIDPEPADERAGLSVGDSGLLAGLGLAVYGAAKIRARRR